MDMTDSPAADRMALIETHEHVAGIRSGQVPAPRVVPEQPEAEAASSMMLVAAVPSENLRGADSVVIVSPTIFVASVACEDLRWDVSVVTSLAVIFVSAVAIEDKHRCVKVETVAESRAGRWCSSEVEGGISQANNSLDLLD